MSEELTSVFIDNEELEQKNKEIIGKVKHDSIKITQGIIDLIGRMDHENHEIVVKDIKRENQLLCQILDSYEKRHIHLKKDADLKKIVWEHAIPFISASPVKCEIRISLESSFSRVYGNPVDIGRAIINIISNSLDAIKESKRKGLISIQIIEEKKDLILSITDNGTGIDKKRLEKGPDDLPLFVGSSSKEIDLGSGIGTKQIYDTFGTQNIVVSSEIGESTTWNIKIEKESTKIKSKHFSGLEKRYVKLLEDDSDSDLITRLRKMEFLLYDLVLQFSRHNNVRNLFICILHCIYSEQPIEKLIIELKEYQIDEIEFKYWIVELVENIKNVLADFHSIHPDPEKIRGTLFKSYNFLHNRTIVFLMDPISGSFMSADRILVEHLDLVPFIEVKKDQLLRGDFSGDLESENDPITLGLWHVSSRDDLIMKIRLIRSCAEKLISMGINPEKIITFYDTINNQSTFELKLDSKLNLREMADFPDEKLESLVVEEEDEMQGMIFTD